MKFSVVRKLLVLPLAMLALAAVSHADTYYLSVVGQKQGQIKGSVTIKGRENSILVSELSHSIVSPRDPQSGLPTGQRMHKPFVVTMPLDKASPLLFQALCTNENLTQVTLKEWNPATNAATGVGSEVQAWTIKLANASISSIDTDVVKDAAGKNQTVLVVAFTYQKIDWTWNDGGITATDSWASR